MAPSNRDMASQTTLPLRVGQVLEITVRAVHTADDQCRWLVIQQSVAPSQHELMPYFRATLADGLSIVPERGPATDLAILHGPPGSSIH
jgi:hypothetical protein